MHPLQHSKKKSYCIVTNKENVPLITTRVQKHTINVVRFEGVHEYCGDVLRASGPIELLQYRATIVTASQHGLNPPDKVNDEFKSD